VGRFGRLHHAVEPVDEGVAGLQAVDVELPVVQRQQVAGQAHDQL
jgi:hypothetical protein